MQHTYKLTGMTCNGCKVSVEDTFKKMKDIKSAIVNLEKGEIKLEMTSYISIKKLQDSLPIKYSIFEREEGNIIIPNILADESQFKQLKPLFVIFGYITIFPTEIND